MVFHCCTPQRYDNRNVMQLHRKLSVGLLTVIWLAFSGFADEVATNATPSQAGLPKWEVGLFGMASRVPLYRGSDEYKLYSFPIPYFIYRGEYIQADKDGVRGLFYKGVRFEFELSMSGNPPVNDGDGARAGMPELDPLVELGPAARFFIYNGQTIKAIYLEAAARGVFSVDMDNLSPDYEGLRSSFSLVLAGIKPQPSSKWTAGLKTGVDFSSRDYHEYFYDVEEPYATPERPYYQSEGGYGGASVSGWISRRLFDGVSAALYARLDNVDGAVYEESPLVRAHNSYMVGAGFTWKIAQSKNQVKRARP